MRTYVTSICSGPTAKLGIKPKGGGQRYIALRLEERRESQQLLVVQIMNDLKAIAFSDITEVLDFRNDGVTLKASSDLYRDDRAAIKRVVSRVTTRKGATTHTTSVELHDKNAALKALEHIMGLDLDLNVALNCLNKYGVKSATRNADGGWDLQYDE